MLGISVGLAIVYLVSFLLSAFILEMAALEIFLVLVAVYICSFLSLLLISGLVIMPDRSRPERSGFIYSLRKSLKLSSSAGILLAALIAVILLMSNGDVVKKDLLSGQKSLSDLFGKKESETVPTGSFEKLDWKGSRHWLGPELK